VSHGDDYDLGTLFGIDQGERESLEHGSPETTGYRLAELWMFTDQINKALHAVKKLKAETLSLAS
jgi:hypothetical protein